MIDLKSYHSKVIQGGFRENFSGAAFGSDQESPKHTE
jgi:hypothetical protein